MKSDQKAGYIFYQMNYRIATILLFTILSFACSDQTEVSDSRKGDNRSVNSNVNAKATPSPTPDQPTANCKSPVSDDERRICKILFAGRSGDDIAEKITYNEVDLNEDKKADLVAWESSWVGQYGSRLWVMQNLGGKYKPQLQRSMAWSPVILLETRSEGWNDIAFRLDGGSTPGFIKVTHSGVTYVESSEVLGPVPPDGTALIGSL